VLIALLHARASVNCWIKTILSSTHTANLNSDNINKPANFREKNLRPWEEGNPFYHEWKANLDKAEYIDLQNVQPGKKWNFFEIKIHSFLINSWIYINIVYNGLKFFFGNTMKYHVLYKLGYYLIYIKNSPERLIGRVGAMLKKYRPDLYNKLKNK